MAVAGILATPLFFVGLMAFSLKLDEPTVHLVNGQAVLGDPLKSTVGLIYLLSIGVSLLVLLVGVLAMLAPRRTGVYLAPLAAIAIALAFRIPLGRWEVAHTARYPLGVDLIPRRDPGDLFLRGEWEENAHRTAEQLSFWTIVLAVAATVIALVLEIRRRRGIVGPAVPPPPPEATMHVG